MIKLFFTDIPDSSTIKELESIYLSRLYDWEQKTYHQFTTPKRQLEFLIGHTLLHQKLNCDFEKHPSGKLISKYTYISLTHTKNLIALALSDNPVGIDAENEKENRNINAIANRMGFLPCPDVTTFYKNWTRYEADYKIGEQSNQISHYFYKINHSVICLACCDNKPQISGYWYTLPETTKKIELNPF